VRQNVPHSRRASLRLTQGPEDWTTAGGDSYSCAVDYSLLALLGMIVAAMIISNRLHSRSWPGRPGWQYQRVLSVGFFGLLLLVSGLIGWDLRRSGGWFNGAKWVDGPVWSQAAIGAAMLMLAGFWARKVQPRSMSAR